MLVKNITKHFIVITLFCFIQTLLPAFNLGFITNPKNGRVKALSKACLDRTYFGSTIIEEPKPRCASSSSRARCLIRSFASPLKTMRSPPLRSFLPLARGRAITKKRRSSERSTPQLRTSSAPQYAAGALS